MYDRSLDLFAPHRPPRSEPLSQPDGDAGWDAALGHGAAGVRARIQDGSRIPRYPTFRPDDLVSARRIWHRRAGRSRRYGVVGGVARRWSPAAPRPPGSGQGGGPERGRGGQGAEQSKKKPKPATETAAPGSGVPLRSNFAETAFWQPHLLTGPDGTATIEFTVPDSVTSWRVFVHGVTQDLVGGTLEKEARTVKELMVRPYLPRFFREGDKAELRVMVNNAGDSGARGRGVARDLRPGHERESGPGVRPAGERSGRGRSRSRREAARRSSSRWPRRRGSGPWPSRSRPRRARSPTASSGRSRSCRDGCTSSSPGSRRSRKGRPRELTFRRTWPRPTTRRASTSSSWSRSTPSFSTACSKPCPTSSTILTNAPSRRSTASSRRAS